MNRGEGARVSWQMLRIKTVLFYLLVEARRARQLKKAPNQNYQIHGLQDAK